MELLYKDYVIYTNSEGEWLIQKGRIWCGTELTLEAAKKIVNLLTKVKK